MKKTMLRMYWKVRIRLQDLRNSFRTRKAVFEDIYDKGGWGDQESKSGSGSTLKNTQRVIAYLPTVIQKYSIKTLLDVPCGDFNWMKEVDLRGVHYTGADIVSKLINENTKRYGASTRTFIEADLALTALPAADLLFCRDCLVHLSYADIFAALKNIRLSGAKYFLVTTFVDHDNVDIVTGNWRPINLQRAPFHFPEPIEVMEEDCSESEGQYQDKALALWRIQDLPTDTYA